MRSKTVWIIIIVLLILAGAIFSYRRLEAPVNTCITNPVGCDDSNLEGTQNATTSQSAATSTGPTSVEIYLVDLGSSATSSQNTIGCGDTLVPIKQEVGSTVGVSVLKASLVNLLSLKQKDIKVGTSTYYNALYQSNLKLDSATVVNGVATVKISGTTELGGECDDPRVIAQIRETVMQFPTIKQANIFINNKPLEDYFSLK